MKAPRSLSPPPVVKKARRRRPTRGTAGDKAAKRAKRDFRALVESTPGVIAVIDARGSIQYANPSIRHVLGYAPEELIGTDVTDFIHPDDLAPAAKAFRDGRHQEEGAAPLELRVRHSDGSWRWLEAASTNALGDSAVAGWVVDAREITERKRVEDALRENTHSLIRLSALTSDYTYALAIEADGRVVKKWVSGALTRITGYTVDEIVGRGGAYTVVHPEDLDRVHRRVQRMLAGEPGDEEFRIVTKDGRVRWIREHTHPQWDDVQRRVVRLYAAASDITERKRAEEHRAALLDIATAISGTIETDEILDRTLRQTRAALQCDLVAGFQWETKTDELRLIAQDGLPAPLAAEVDALRFRSDHPFGRVLARGEPVVINDPTTASLLPATLLERFHIESLAAVPLSVAGRHTGALVAAYTTRGRPFGPEEVELLAGIGRQLAVGLETTQLFHTQAEEVRTWATLARVGQEMVGSPDRTAVLQRLCQSTADALHCDTSHLWFLSADDELLIPAAGHGDTPEDWATTQALRIPRVMVADELLRLEREGMIEEVVETSPNNATRSLRSRYGIAVGLYLALRRGSKLVGILTAGQRQQQGFSEQQKHMGRGIAQLASLALENAQLVEELQSANRLKSEFVSTMSHELRTPLNIIMGYTDLLRGGTFGPLNPEQTDALQRTEQSACRLLDLVNAMLDLGRLDAGRVQLDLCEVDLLSLLRDLEGADGWPAKPGVRYVYELPPQLPLLSTDPLKLRVVIRNLIENAIKFTDAGDIVVAAVARPDGIEVRVSDTGIGISPELQSIIFEPFRQGDSSTTNGYGGVGLGLYIVRRFVDLLEGTVTIESQVGHGSTFRVWLPLERGESRGSRQGLGEMI